MLLRKLRRSSDFKGDLHKNVQKRGLLEKNGGCLRKNIALVVLGNCQRNVVMWLILDVLLSVFCIDLDEGTHNCCNEAAGENPDEEIAIAD